MRFILAASLVGSSVTAGWLHSPRGMLIERIGTHDNRTPAGQLRSGVLTIRLEAREGEWHPTSDADPAIAVRAFAEEGKPLVVPGPLIRVPEGTKIHAFVRNSFPRGTLVVHGLAAHGVAGMMDRDTMQIRPGAVREVQFTAGAIGTYYYRATLDGVPEPDAQTRNATLSGAFVVDPRGAPVNPRDRIFLISLWQRDSTPAGTIGRNDVLRFTINGKAWPYTERLTYNAGDSVRFRIINASVAPHPMHLHGFYFNVDSRGDGSTDSLYRRDDPYVVVTERVATGRTATMTWIPERPGNWLFHCHDNYHVLRNAPLDGTRLPAEHELHAKNHALEMMGGLVMGIEVKATTSAEVVSQGAARRKLRLVAREDSGGTIANPSYGYVLEDAASRSGVARSLIPGPTLLLERGKPVSITVVNRLREPTAVHWHGIELDSYFDGVADFAGLGKRIAPPIAPGDSFEARFTPPRSGTFIYHPHADEVRQLQAGMSGALLVVDSPAAFDSTKDIVVMLTVPRLTADAGVILINGAKNPAPLQLRVGERYRFRIIDIHSFRPSMIVRLTRDSTVQSWRPLAKDGMDLPAARAVMRPAVQQMGNGETYDFEYTPAASGEYRLSVISSANVPLGSMPIRVR